MDPNGQPKTILPRPQTNDNCNGPRVSFNKDVHVKRIGNFDRRNILVGIYINIKNRNYEFYQFKNGESFRNVPLDSTQNTPHNQCIVFFFHMQLHSRRFFPCLAGLFDSRFFCAVHIGAHM